MIYLSNLTRPDLAPHFKLRSPMMLTHGHFMPSDPDFLPDCGYFTHDEAAILYSIAKAWPRKWADIGARLGWTSVHIAAAGAAVDAVDPELMQLDFRRRFFENTAGLLPQWAMTPVTCGEYFDNPTNRVNAACIDGNHSVPEPTRDAMRAISAGAKVLVWHDFWGDPVADAVDCVIDLGWKCRTYDTPNGLAVCWVPDCGFIPPDHVPDPAVDWAERRSWLPRFDFKRCV